jgi:hypothetical protein
MKRCTYLLALLVALWPAAHAGHAAAQQRTAPSKKPVYDQYEPSRVLRTGRQGCMREEEPVGAYCVKVCQKNYVPVPNSNPPLCRSIDPLPPGQQAGAIWKETAPLPKPAGSHKPYVPSGGH